MAYDAMLNKKHLQTLIRPFGLTADDLEFIQFSQNYVYRNIDRSKIVRISTDRHRTIEQVESELDWIKFLSESGIKTPQPLCSDKGELYHQFNIDGDSFIVCCFEYAPGKPIFRHDADILEFRSLGNLTGKLHKASQSFSRLERRTARPIWYDSRLLREDFSTCSQAISAPFKESVQDLIQSLQKENPSPSSFGLIHSDISFNNLFHEDGDYWIFDFDNCEYGYFLQDLATVLYDSIYCKCLNLFADDGLNLRMKPLWDSFTEGYAGSFSTHSIDMDRLKKFFILREAVIYVHYHRTLNIDSMSETFHKGLAIMRKNIETQTHQVDFSALETVFA